MYQSGFFLVAIARRQRTHPLRVCMNPVNPVKNRRLYVVKIAQ
jgi:hypothetical protein